MPEIRGLGIDDLALAGQIPTLASLSMASLNLPAFGPPIFERIPYKLQN